MYHSECRVAYLHPTLGVIHVGPTHLNLHRRHANVGPTQSDRHYDNAMSVRPTLTDVYVTQTSVRGRCTDIA